MSAHGQGDVSQGTDTGRPGASRARLVAWGLAAALLLLLSWPGCEGAVRFPDTAEYLHWPEPVKADGYMRLGPRMPVYAFVLKGLGTGPPLVYFQVALSLACWGLLGWRLAGAAGAFLAGLMLLAPEMRIWQLSALTESLTFSLLSGLVAGGLLLGSRWRWDGAALWGFGLVCFGLLRPANALIVPFLLAPLLPQLRPLCRSRPAPAGPVAAPGRFFAAMGLAICVALAGWLLAERSEFWRMNYTTALMERVVTDAEARDYFRAAGMPTPVVWGSDAFSEWFEAHARATYQGWVISRAQSYADAWWWLRPDWQRDEILERYGDRAGILRLDSAAWRPASWLYSATAPPRALWLTALLGALALTVWRRPPGVHAVVASLLAVGAYVQCFVALHASAAEEVRHTLGASMLYRIAFMLVLRGIWDALSSGLRGR